MGSSSMQFCYNDIVICNSGIKFDYGTNLHPTTLFASVAQAGFGFGISPNPPTVITVKDSVSKFPLLNSSMKYALIHEPAIQSLGFQGLIGGDEVLKVFKKSLGMRRGFKLKFKIGNSSARKLISGAIAGAVSRTVVAPLETIRTHLMVGSCGHDTTHQVFQSIMEVDGWKGLFRGNLVNIIRVAPSKAIELFAYDTVMKQLSPKDGEQPEIPIPAY